jgi:hypothetical protein
MILTEEMLQTWHGDSLYHLAEGADIKGNVCATREFDRSTKRAEKTRTTKAVVRATPFSSAS